MTEVVKGDEDGLVASMALRLRMRTWRYLP